LLFTHTTPQARFKRIQSNLNSLMADLKMKRNRSARNLFRRGERYTAALSMTRGARARGLMRRVSSLVLQQSRPRGASRTRPLLPPHLTTVVLASAHTCSSSRLRRRERARHHR